MKTILSFLVLASCSILVSSCCSPKKTTREPAAQAAVTIPGPKLFIYKTKGDYSKLVPVTLSADKKTVVSYPDIKDIFFNGNLAYPTPLHKGYLLDNRGIDRNSAFLKLSYEEYSKLPRTPDSEELFKLILDPDPFTTLLRYDKQISRENAEKELNDRIDKGNFSDFTKLK